MRERPQLFEGPYLVVGLARSGVSAAYAVSRYGKVIGCDAGSPPQAQALSDIECHLFDSGTGLLEGVRTVIKSPGVPNEAPVIERARSLGIEVVGELELAWRLLSNQFVAVTGTNGKTTTVELLGAIYRKAGIGVCVAGNVGRPVSDLIGSVDAKTVIVCEVSSFQLEDANSFAPDCGVLLNITSDHLDRHKTFENYRAAKLSLFSRQTADELAVVPDGTRPPGAGRVVTFGSAGSNLVATDGRLWWEGQPVIEQSDIRLRGAHNQENAMAAAAAALASGVHSDAVAEALEEFAGVAHRLEEVATRNGVLFVNDSKATNIASTQVGVAAFDNVHLILGGSLKGGDFAALRDTARCCQRLYLIGEAAAQLEKDLAQTAPITRCDDLPTAVESAAKLARPGEVVLLSPACASFDHYEHYQQRGEHFKELVSAL
jgi:UDP-N-acetylmuramoylalanine--D-glutamate ligase